MTELLLSLTLTAVAGTLLIGSLSQLSGVTALKMAGYSRFRQVQRLFELMKYDLFNAVNFTCFDRTICGFNGSPDRFNFNIRSGNRVGIARYYSERTFLIREENDLNAVHDRGDADQGESGKEALLKGVTSVGFKYISEASPEDKVWRENWLNNYYPSAIQVVIDFSDGKRIQKVLAVPLGARVEFSDELR